MKLKTLEARRISEKGFSKLDAKKALIRLLQDAHAGELAAAYAYYGHAKSLFVRDKQEKREIFKIYEEELHHRAELFKMLKGLNSKPRFFRERLMQTIGFVIGFLCLFGGWFIPMYGAARLESQNIEEYEVAARLAHLAGYTGLTDLLVEFAEKEWDHEDYFKKKTQSHVLHEYFPAWVSPGRRDDIRSKFIEFRNQVLFFNK